MSYLTSYYDIVSRLPPYYFRGSIAMASRRPFSCFVGFATLLAWSLWPVLCAEECLVVPSVTLNK